MITWKFAVHVPWIWREIDAFGQPFNCTVCLKDNQQQQLPAAFDLTRHIRLLLILFPGGAVEVWQLGRLGIYVVYGALYQKGVHSLKTSAVGANT